MSTNSITAVQVQNTTVEGLISLIREVIKENTPKPPKPQETELLTRREVCNLLSVSLTTLHNWNKSKILTPYRIGNKVRYKKDEVMQAMQRMN